MTGPTLRTAYHTGDLCPCGAPMATDSRSIWCVRGRQCPALPAQPQCPHGLPAGGQCGDCDADMDALPSLVTIARRYAAEWPRTDVGRLAYAYLAQLDEAGVEP